MNRALVPAFGAGLVSALAFWWVFIGWLCPDCDAAGECVWRTSCVGWVGVPLALVLVGLALAVPYRLLEGRWPGRRR